MRNWKILTMDEERVIADANRVGQRVWRQVLASGPLALPGRHGAR